LIQQLADSDEKAIRRERFGDVWQAAVSSETLGQRVLRAYDYQPIRRSPGGSVPGLAMVLGRARRHVNRARPPVLRLRA
jgi:hypothetical protein